MKKKLDVKKTSVKTLTNVDLKQVVGGAVAGSGSSCCCQGF